MSDRPPSDQPLSDRPPDQSPPDHSSSDQSPSDQSPSDQRPLPRRLARRDPSPREVWSRESSPRPVSGRERRRPRPPRPISGALSAHPDSVPLDSGCDPGWATASGSAEVRASGRTGRKSLSHSSAGTSVASSGCWRSSRLQRTTTSTPPTAEIADTPITHSGARPSSGLTLNDGMRGRVPQPAPGSPRLRLTGLWPAHSSETGSGRAAQIQFQDSSPPGGPRQPDHVLALPG
jgi:hypothetical protein